MAKFNVYFDFESLYRKGVEAENENEAEALVLAELSDSIKNAVKTGNFNDCLLKVALCEVTDNS